MKHRNLTLATLLLLASAALICTHFIASASVASAAAAVQRQRRAPSRQRQPAQTRTPAVDYTKFSHRTAQHQKACASCHTSPTENWAQARARDAAFPDVTDYPEHGSCLDCHRRQFFTGARPAICSVCHTVVSPRAGERFPFENPAEVFEKSEKAKGRASDCAGCHKLLPPGQSAAPKVPAHTDADPTNPSAKGITDPNVFAHWTERRVARFKHEQSDHEGVYSKFGCSYCHIAITGENKISSNTLYVPIQTCATSNCHGAKTGAHNIIFKEVEQRKKPDGANYQCAKCHINLGKDPTPKSHTDLFAK